MGSGRINMGWGMAILPFLEQSSVWNLYNDTHPNYYEGSSGTAIVGWPLWDALSAQKNIQAQSTVINVYTCPSSPIPAAERVYDRTVGSGSTARISRESAIDYATSDGIQTGSNRICTGISGGADHNNFGQVSQATITLVSFGLGAVDWRRPQIAGTNTAVRRRIQDISDGTAYTVAVYEKAGGPKAWYGRKVMSSSDEAFFITQWATNNVATPGAPANGTQTSASTVAGSYGFNDPDRSAAALTGAMPNGLSTGSDGRPGATCPINCSNRSSNLSGWYAFHDGGAHVLLADGTVRFISDQVGRLTWCYLMTSQGNENIEF
jgi:hypothetical protein